jgi:hypothetical protein
MINEQDLPREDDRDGSFVGEEKALENLKRAETEIKEAAELEELGRAYLRAAEKELEAARHPVFIFYVGKEKFATHCAVLTGAEIKAGAKDFPQGYGLELEGHGEEPDRLVRDDEKIHMDPHCAMRFTAVPPATFGSVAP